MQSLEGSTRPSSFFYGWVIVLVAMLCYGFSISPAYYSWGFLQPEMIRDLGFTRKQVGGVFGLFVLIYSFVSPLAGIAISRFGVRAVIILGSAVSSAGFLFLSRADSVLDCYIGFSILIGLGVGLSSIIPAQTLASNWFTRYRARAMGFILAGGGLVGMLMPPINAFVLARGAWSTVWIVLAGISIGVAALAFVFVRNRPEDLGQFRDGANNEAADSGNSDNSDNPSSPATSTPPDENLNVSSWTARQAMMTRQFAMITFCGVAYAVPYSTLMPHIRLHLDTLNFSLTDAAFLVALIPFMSILGRFSGGLGDFFKPQRLLALALVLEAAGLAGISIFQGKAGLSISLGLIALGFGAGYVSIPVLFSAFFGRAAFATTSGVRISISGIFNGLGPVLAGGVHDRWASYNPAFFTLVAVCLLGSVCALFLSPPALPSQQLNTP